MSQNTSNPNQAYPGVSAAVNGQKPNKFKTGDVVICIDDTGATHLLKQGDVYSVWDASHAGTVSVDAGRNYWNDSRFEHATAVTLAAAIQNISAMPKAAHSYAVGDFAEVTGDNGSNHGFLIGQTVKIIAITNGVDEYQAESAVAPKHIWFITGSEMQPFHGVLINGGLNPVTALNQAGTGPMSFTMPRRGAITWDDPEVQLVDAHYGHEIVDNQAMGKPFRYCRDCRKEVS